VLDGLPASDEWAGTWVRVELNRPGWEQRRAFWGRQLADVAADISESGLDTIAARFDLSFPEIRAAVADAAGNARALGRGPTAAELMDAARRHSSRALESLAEVMTPARRWSDLILPTDAMGQLRDLCDRVRRRHRVLDRWGFGREPRGNGVNALFVGAPGTGKTLAAEAVAGELGLNLYRIDLATVVSKYIGETEKNLDRLFRAAERSNAVLLFDEADALFGRRSIVRDAHDRYANVEIAYLLQRLESYPGVAILTTNLSDNLDQAFTRRLAFTVHFPFPAPAERLRIWEAVWPPEAPLGPGLQLRWLAERFKLTGGNIRNVALAAACLVADGGSIGMTQVLQAVRREYQKMGKAVADRELEPPGEPLQAVAS
jgi:SpoVK/Ycf46/Vps4 family AAA+-type ATPase